MTLTFLHFFFTVLWYSLLSFTGAFVKPPPGAIPKLEQFKVAAVIFASIGLMNLSLNANSIGFYQVTLPKHGTYDPSTCSRTSDACPRL
jgi:hypothetical protein